MARKRKRQSTTRAQAYMNPVDRGTCETRRHWRRSTIQRLVETGRVGGFELRAAQELEAVFVYISAGLFARIMNYAERVDPARSDQAPGWFRDAYYRRYKPFADDPSSGFQICVAVLVDGRSGRMIDTERKWPRGTAVNVLIRALRSYALAAGWPDAETAEQWRLEQAA